MDDCGNPTYACSNDPDASIGPCTPDCKPPEEPCECGPDKPCQPCFQCIDSKCVRIEDCCTSDEDCGPCSKCVDGRCEPCGECEQCLNGLCLPCGPCQKCEDGGCVECGSDEVCIEGVCVPKQYYCCWESCPDEWYDDNGTQKKRPVDPPPGTTCIEAEVGSGGFESPCGYGVTPNKSPPSEAEDCDLTKSGPFVSLQQCEPQCERYDCVPDACGYRQCVPASDGPYTSMGECLSGQYDSSNNLTVAACVEDPCSEPCTFGGATVTDSAPTKSLTYAIDGCERDICVSYSSLRSRPIRVQIWGPTLDSNCNVIASRVIKADSDWRGEECCDCPDDRGDGQLEGGPKGQITWTKPRGVTSFEVYVFFPCPKGGDTYELNIECSDNCTPTPNPELCICADDDDCADGCHCCGGRCQPEPCACDPNQECEYVVVSCTCDPELDPNPYPIRFATLAEALAYTVPAGCGACTADPVIGTCCATAPDGDLQCVDPSGCGDVYCTTCGPLDTGTKLGPYATEAAAITAGWDAANDCNGDASLTVECDDGWYIEVCCEAAP